MGDVDLAAYYAEGKRRHDIAGREFRKRRHGWHFDLATGADRWAEAYAAAESAADVERGVREPYAWASRLVEAADADGMIVKPEPGRIRSAYSHRDSCTEDTVAIGFGFWPDDAEFLIVRAGSALHFDVLTPAIGGDGMAVLAVLRSVIATFDSPRAFNEPAPPPAR